ncbi:hypothetical protein ACIQBJ_32515 [Kitasatospora sp. NPDC088391]|uniref:DUF7507 domain-containing protein n=1 Tax=Kitasatospora sp. NPDC088391 TaxID=3364074 RepID=UPI003821AC4B
MRDILRLSVSTNASADPAVRLRAGGTAIRTYRLDNRADYPLGDVVLTDPQLPGGRLRCAPGRTVPPGGSLDCTATLTVEGGPRSTRVEATAEAPLHLPQAHADTSAGYLGITSGIRLTRVGAPSGSGLSRRAASPAGAGADGSPAALTPSPSSFPPPPATAVRRGAVAGAGGTVELRYRLEAFGDVPITDASVTDNLPGLGAVNCTGPDGGRTLAPGQTVDCRATGIARPGRQTGTARAGGLADDGTVGPDGNRQAPRRVSAEADGAYDGLRPTPSGTEPGGPSEATPNTGPGPGPEPGGGPGTGTATGPTTGTGPGAGPGQGVGPAPVGPGPGTSASPGQGAGGGDTPAGGQVPPGLLPVSVPPGAGPVAAVAARPPVGASQPRPEAAGSMPPLVPFLPGRSPELLPGGRVFARPASPFAAPGAGGAPTASGGSPSGPGAAHPGDAASGQAGAAPGPGASAGSVVGSGARNGAGAALDALAAARQQASPGARSADPLAQAEFGGEGRAPDEEDDSWDGAEVMMLLLAILLPVLCVLAAAFTARGRGRR